jgi:hypothetical protein
LGPSSEDLFTDETLYFLLSEPEYEKDIIWKKKLLHLLKKAFGRTEPVEKGIYK